MNRLVHLIFLDLKLLTKSKTFYLKLILFPAALILILGTVFDSSSSKPSTFNMAFYNEDVNISYENNSISLGNTLEDKVLNSQELKSIINLKKVTTYSEGKKLIDEGKAAVFVYVPKGFTESFLKDENTSLILIGNKNNAIDKSIVKSILDRFIENTRTVVTEEKEASKLLNSNKTLQPMDIQKILNHLKDENTYTTIISKVPTNNKMAPIRGMQYYSITMVVMFSILTAFTLVHGIVEDKLNNTLFRIKSTPTLNLQYALGKLFGVIFAIVAQMSIIIILTSLVFKLNWGNPFEILLITLVYAFTLGALVLLWGLTAKDQASVSSLASPILYGFSFLGGSFINKYSLPDSLKLVQQIIPNGKAINSYLKICQGMGISSIYMDLAELLLIGSVFLAMALSIYNGRKWINNANAHNDKKAIETTV